MVLDEMHEHGHEQVTYFSEPDAGLRAIIAIHDTSLGPSLGGTRILDYESEAAAREDVLRLSHAMTYKAAAADLDLGGGKAVILGDPEEIKDEALLSAYGRAVDSLAGRYITSVDMNSTVGDMDVIARETDHVVGTSDGLGDPSEVTAHGALHGIRATVEHQYGRDSLTDREVVVQGIGKVGAALVEKLLDRGARVTVTDVDRDALETFTGEHDVDTVGPAAVYDEPCDVFVPCAVGGVVNDETIPRLSCDIVAGVANNVLAERRHARALADAGIYYAPDYVLNAGGLITVAQEYRDGSLETAYAEAEGIRDRLLEMIEHAEETGVTVLEAAEAYAEDRLAGTDGGLEPLPGAP